MSSAFPGVTVVIPTWNRSSELSKAIDSALNQTWTKIEILVVDDGSTDGTRELLEEYRLSQPDRIRVLHKEHKGVSAARNAGIRESRYDLIAFLDSDDTWSPDKLARQVAAITDDPSVGLVFTGCSGGVVDSAHVRVPEPWDTRAESALEQLLVGCCIVPSTVLVRRRDLQSVGLFDPSLSHCEDHDLWFRLALAGCRMAHIPASLAQRGEATRRLSADPVSTAAAYDRIIPRILNEPRLPRHLQRNRGKHLARWQLTNAERYLAGREGRRAAAALRRAAFIAPGSIRPGWFKLYWNALRMLAQDRRPAD